MYTISGSKKRGGLVFFYYYLFFYFFIHHLNRVEDHLHSDASPNVVSEKMPLTSWETLSLVL